MRSICLPFLALLVLCGGLGLLALSPRKEPVAARPNIIYIMADDLGYGDIGPYGQEKINTPHLDQLAAEGLKFNQFYAGSTVCAPSRCALMTGKHTGHNYIRGNGEIPLRAEDTILPQYLQKEGYTTGMFGKWGLGDMNTTGMPDLKGWNSFVGFLHHVEAHFQLPGILWHFKQGTTPIRERIGTAHQGFANDFIAEKAVDFIEENKSKPFFLYLSLTIPHAELVMPDKLLSRYQDPNGNSVFGTEVPYPGLHYGGQRQPRAAYAAMVSRVDDYVGNVRAKLGELGLEENTLIFFTSDNGTHVEGGRTTKDVEFFKSSGPLRGVKRDMYEGGIRVPGIAYWKGKIKPGQTTDFYAASWDWLPTLLELSGSKARPETDGVSMASLFTDNKAPNVGERPLYWEFHEGGFSQALRKGDWKIVRLKKKDGSIKTELYNLKKDLSEQKDLAATQPDRLRQMEQLLDAARTKSEHPAFVTLGY
ncbi:arylsulfatase [Telluribacter humicola]|uniref:arylsulfatase n=1 Tax=Telluribacter humicola TaxID=1720261 RepID=UPI001A96AC1D|nr:arylsulfatase [Telluribacter humicola]